MSGNFLRTYEAELQDRVPGIRRKIGIQALLNAMRSRTLQRNNALQAPLVPVIDLDGDLESRPVAGSVSWDNAMYTLFRRSFPFAADEAWARQGWPLRFPQGPGRAQNPTNYWVSMIVKRLAMQFRAAIARARKRLQDRYLENYSSGYPLLDLF